MKAPAQFFNVVCNLTINESITISINNMPANTNQISTVDLSIMILNPVQRPVLVQSTRVTKPLLSDLLKCLKSYKPCLKIEKSVKSYRTRRSGSWRTRRQTDYWVPIDQGAQIPSSSTTPVIVCWTVKILKLLLDTNLRMRDELIFLHWTNYEMGIVDSTLNTFSPEFKKWQCIIENKKEFR